MEKARLLAAVRKDWRALESASEQWKGDKDILLAAVRQDWYALEYASEGLKGDKDVVLAAVGQNGSVHCNVQAKS